MPDVFQGCQVCLHTVTYKLTLLMSRYRVYIARHYWSAFVDVKVCLICSYHPPIHLFRKSVLRSVVNSTMSTLAYNPASFGYAFVIVMAFTLRVVVHSELMCCCSDVISIVCISKHYWNYEIPIGKYNTKSGCMYTV